MRVAVALLTRHAAGTANRGRAYHLYAHGVRPSCYMAPALAILANRLLTLLHFAFPAPEFVHARAAGVTSGLAVDNACTFVAGAVDIGMVDATGAKGGIFSDLDSVYWAVEDADETV